MDNLKDKQIFSYKQITRLRTTMGKLSVCAFHLRYARSLINKHGQKILYRSQKRTNDERPKTFALANFYFFPFASNVNASIKMI